MKILGMNVVGMPRLGLIRMLHTKIHYTCLLLHTKIHYTCLLLQTKIHYTCLLLQTKIHYAAGKSHQFTLVVYSLLLISLVQQSTHYYSLVQFSSLLRYTTLCCRQVEAVEHTMQLVYQSALICLGYQSTHTFSLVCIYKFSLVVNALSYSTLQASGSRRQSIQLLYLSVH